MNRLIICMFFLVAFTSCVEKVNQKNAYQELRDITEKKLFKKNEKFLAHSYCYFVFQGVLNPTQVTPKLFSLYVKGGSLSQAYLKDYANWLQTENGKLCQQVIGEDFQHLSISKGKKYIVLLNQMAIERDKESVELIYHHELLHVAYAHFPNQREKVQKQWTQLTPKQQQSFKQKRVGYNFENPKILQREFFAYSYQNHPEEGVMMLVR